MDETKIIEGIEFSLHSGETYNINHKTITEITVYLNEKYGKNTFLAGELTEEWGFIQPRVSTLIGAEEEKILTLWIERGGSFILNHKDAIADKITSNNYQDAYNELPHEMTSSSRGGKKIILLGVLGISGVTLVISVYFFLRNGDNYPSLPQKIASPENTGTSSIQEDIPGDNPDKTILGEGNPDRTNTVISVENREGNDAKLIHTAEISGTEIPKSIYYFDSTLLYSISDGSNPNNIKTTFYDTNNKKVIDSEDSIIVHDIKDGKITYTRYDDKRDGYLYTDTKLIAKNGATPIKLRDSTTYRINSFNFQKFGEKIVFMTYNDSSKTYSVNYDGKDIGNFTSNLKISYINGNLYIIGSEKGGFSLYKNNKKIATSDLGDFWLRAIGDSVGYQVSDSGVFSLYLGEKKIAEQEGVSISFQDIDGKIAYDVYDNVSGKTTLYWGENEIAKVPLTKARNGIIYGSEKGKFYYSYALFSAENKNSKEKDVTIFRGKTYENISDIQAIGEESLAYKKYNPITKENELYLDDALMASGQVMDFGEMSGKLYFVFYNKKDKVYSLNFDGTIINSNKQRYSFEKVINGIYYKVLNPETNEEEVYINEKKVASGIKKAGLIYMQMPREGENMKNIKKMVYTQKSTGEFELQSKNGSIPLKSGEILGPIANEYSQFYIASKEGGNITIYVYQIQ